MQDSILHSLLGALLLPVLWALIVFCPLWFAVATLIAVMLFWREATQEQTKHYDSDIRRGWAFWKWSASKNAETWIPIGVVYALAWLTI